MKFGFIRSLCDARSLAMFCVCAGLISPASALASVSHTTGQVGGVQCDIWTWNDSNNLPRTVALKMEGQGNAGHGGYAVQMTYFASNESPYKNAEISWQKITVSAANESDGGFGYFVSHERYRLFSDNSQAPIANRIFNLDDSPLGLSFSATASIPLNTSAAGAESFTINYGHYGTIVAGGFNANTGVDSPPLSLNPADYQFYTIPVTTTWVFQAGRDFPRIDVSVDMSQIVPPGANSPKQGLVSFDVRGPYGVMVFDNGEDGVVTNAMWGDQEFVFSPLSAPITRGDSWNWSTLNFGARHNVLTTGSLPGTSYEMGLFEPLNAARSALADGYAGERGYNNASFAQAGGASWDQCGDPQILPSDGEWPFQSVQYSLPCAAQNSNYLTATTTGKKIAWGSASFYGFILSGVYNGQQSYPINNFPPAPYKLNYGVCLVLGRTQWPQAGGTTHSAAPRWPITKFNAGLYTQLNPNPSSSNCATATP
jgi:hypothetical protein